ncbi:hypothetical protein PT2222_90323 [Paraburkholderia tropica]
MMLAQRIATQATNDRASMSGMFARGEAIDIYWRRVNLSVQTQ